MAARYQDDDYRAFIFATHPVHGMLLLHCTRKKKKPPHFQAPGGHVDKADFDEAIATIPETNHEGSALLMNACKIGAARELYEETQIDIRSSLDRLQPVRLRESSNKELFSELKKRLFFKLCLEDDDFVTTGIESKVSMGLYQSMNPKPPNLMLKLSHEHQGFIFANTTKSVELLVEHSGGKVAKALRMAIEQDDITKVENKDPSIHEEIKTNEDTKIVGNPKENEANDSSEKKRFGCFSCC